MIAGIKVQSKTRSMLTSWTMCSIWCQWGMWFEHSGEIPLWTGIVWPSGDYTFILDEGNISAWCCRVRVVNYRRVIYYWIKNGGKNNSWQDAFSSVLIWWRANWDQHTRASEGINIHFSGRLCQWTFPSCLLSGCLHLFNLRIHWLFFYFFSLK